MRVISFAFFALYLSMASAAQTIPGNSAIDAKIHTLMTQTHANGMAVAVIDHGKISYVQAYGIRNPKGDPLTINTVMYGASLTKTVFAYTVLQLVDQDKLKQYDVFSIEINVSRRMGSLTHLC